ncbi:hypothetical protein Glove_352g48 [Diversispora epigaea]|uniref:BTB domain-containing protein n=1 Tax=Diversispora epigaea TaxID=1348612 RepID=A0A397HG54_9GLOM|nr:hypothetical protein Glove_352g48 [Diversispora epigaea]
MSFKLFEKLSQNFIELLNDKNDYNVIVEVENKKSFTAHSNILKCRSTYFHKELENIIPNENNIKTITKPNISNQIFDIILKYIYGGIVDLENVETRIIFDLMKAANEFEIEELVKQLENYLIGTKSSWLKSHFSLVYRSIFSGNNFKDLEKFCNDIIVKYPNLIFDAEDFTSLQESALISLLKRDDLQLEEIKVWEYIIKWGISQNSTLPAELEEWTKENFTILKTTLQQCLPFIRFSSTDVWNKVKPYKKILDKQLWEDLNQRFMVPDQPVKIILPPRTILVQELPTRTIEQTKPPSTIITYEHVAEISSWIDRKSKSALISLLKRDDLQLEEIKVWEYIIKWGISQNSTLPAELEEWTKENFTILKTTLQQCLPFIRFSSTDVWNKVKPYKKILDKQLWEDLNQRFMVPDQPVKIILPPRTILVQELPTRTIEQTKPPSTIITYEHVAEISSWIDRKSSIYSLTNTPYEFQLLLRGSINGFAPQTFWDTCNGHASTVVIMKVKGTEEILGGYNPLAWDANSAGRWGNTNDSFIFSLKNGNIQNSILSRVKIPTNAIWNVGKISQYNNGPYFGYDLYMFSPSSNFTLDNRCVCHNNNGHYEKPIRTTIDKFSIVDYEVFKHQNLRTCKYICGLSIPTGQIDSSREYCQFKKSIRLDSINGNLPYIAPKLYVKKIKQQNVYSLEKITRREKGIDEKKDCGIIHVTSVNSVMSTHCGGDKKKITRREKGIDEKKDCGIIHVTSVNSVMSTHCGGDKKLLFDMSWMRRINYNNKVMEWQIKIINYYDDYDDDDGYDDLNDGKEEV